MVNQEVSSPAVERVWRQVREDPRAALESGLIPTDLQTVLLAVARTRAQGVSAARLMRRFGEDAFVQPSPSDPRALWKMETRLWELLPTSFVGIDLSPVTPLGTCAAVASVDQNRVITTVRGSEVVSDPTNVLALEAARRRRQTPTAAVHLAACHRVMRAQRFSGPGLLQHFRLFALVSSDRDQGSGALEAAMLTEHLGFWARALADLLPGRRAVMEFSAFDSATVLERYRDTVVPALEPGAGAVVLQEDPERQRARGYYNLAAIRLCVEADGAVVELGDGGFTDWTAQLTADAKERCLTSCISTERLNQLRQTG